MENRIVKILDGRRIKENNKKKKVLTENIITNQTFSSVDPNCTANQRFILRRTENCLTLVHHTTKTLCLKNFFLFLFQKQIDNTKDESTSTKYK